MITPAHAPTAIHVQILPYQNRVIGDDHRYHYSIADNEVDYRAQVVISMMSVTHESECWHPEYYTTHDYHSSRDALFQQCVNRLKATITGSYQLRQGNTNQLIHSLSLHGYGEISYFFARRIGDLELIPAEKQTMPAEAFVPPDYEGLRVALQDFNKRLKIDIQHYFEQKSAGVVIVFH